MTAVSCPDADLTELQLRPGDESPTAQVLRLVTFSTLYPNKTEPNHGIFVENRLRHLLDTRQASSSVVAPVPWFPTALSIFGRYAAFARIPRSEMRRGIAIEHPRFPAIPKIGMILAPFGLFAASLPQLRRTRSEFDLIDAHYFYPDGVAAIMLGHVLKKPVVITARGTDVNLIPRHPIARRLIQAAARRTAGIIAVSVALKDALVALDVPPEKITVLRNGVDLELFRPSGREAARAALNLTGRTLLSVGHLIERKGHDIIISALPRLASYALLIVGDGPERKALEGLAARLGVADRVRFTGSIAHDRLAQIYEASDALVLASSREGWPNVLLESMACGTAVVASNIWGNPEIVCRPEAGVLMPSRTVEGVVAGVESFFGALPNRQDTRKFAENFSWDQTSQGQIELFRKILEEHPRHP